MFYRSGAGDFVLGFWPLGCILSRGDFVRSPHAGASIHMGQGGHVPQYLDVGDIITNVPLNISRVISATLYPCNIFLII